jgi:hypothetical protein
MEDIKVLLRLDLRKCPERNLLLDATTQAASFEDAPAAPTPDLSPNHHRANAHQVGPNAKSQALALRYHRRLLLGKVPHVTGRCCNHPSLRAPTKKKWFNSLELNQLHWLRE